MSHLTPDVLESMLAEYGWTFENVGENEWSTGFQGEQQLFPLSIRLSHTCVSFEVRPLVELTLDVRRWPDLSRELLELNARLQLVKVALSETGEVTLACQVLAAGFDYEMLSRTLGILGYYADEVAPEISQKMAASAYRDRPVFLS